MTCDAWQASNTDSYFAVTGHWIEEANENEWVLQSALFGFTRMNTAHNGKRLGQALFKICDRLDIVKKVRTTSTLSLLRMMTEIDIQQIGHITSDNASNNMTMLDEFAVQYHRKVGEVFNVNRAHIR